MFGFHSSGYERLNSNTVDVQMMLDGLTFLRMASSIGVLDVLAILMCDIDRPREL